MWQGASVPGSIFQLDFLSVISTVQLYEVILLLGVAALVAERWMTGDYTFKRSYFSAPLLLMCAMLVFSWIRGQWMQQTFRPIFEAHEAFLIPIGFLFFINVFRDIRERKVMVWLFVLAAVMKAADATWIRAFPIDVGTLWGALLMWRDGYILSMGIIGAMLLAHYQGFELKRLRTVSLITFPFLAYGLLISYRRTFILALILSLLFMFVTLGKGRRGRHVRNFLLMFVIILVFVLVTDPLGIIARMAAVFMPAEEGSSYLRIIEYPNIFRNIADNPIFGVPVGVRWHQYYQVPLFGNSSRLGTHNTYLYWPLRMGIGGAIGFFWLLARVWKAVLINWRLQRSEEDFFYNHFLLYGFIVYNFACFFGLMYADAMSILTGVVLVLLQLQMEKITGLTSLKHVDFWKTIRRKELVFRPKIQLTPEAARLADELRLAKNNV
jgi:O-antigen ligase